MAKSKRKRKSLPEDASSRPPTAMAEPTGQPPIVQPPIAQLPVAQLPVAQLPVAPPPQAEPGIAQADQHSHEREQAADPSASVTQAAVVAEVASAAADETPLNKACGACGLSLPLQARFCSGCGEPQIPGLERPIYLVPPAAEPRAAEPPAADLVARPAAQVVVPSVPRVAPRASGTPLIPSLTADRPIPASLLQPGASPEPFSLRLNEESSVQPDTAMETTQPPVAHPNRSHEPAFHLPAPTAATADDSSNAPATLVPAGATPEHTAAPQLMAQQPLPLFDPATEARMLGLRTSHEITLERFERLMVGFRLKPKPRVAAAKPKAPPKDKADKKPKEKPAKGH